jgi:ABC-type polysaccharide/polyol phosphate transport system ATPase subunit
MDLIKVENVSKTFKPRSGARTLLTRGGLVNMFRRRPTDVVSALKDISFTVGQGEAVGIIGANGSGKSTLLKLLAGVSSPSTGVVEVQGRVASLLELGAGFHPLLTGRENVYLNARILGVGRAQVDRVFDQIVEFSGIGDFLDNPVNTYSSGMFVRLGFAVAVHTDPDIFLVDEVLSVGDEEFQRKCRTRIGELREQGKTLVFVSHDLSIVNTLCNRVILLSKGKMISRGTPSETIDFYLRQIGREAGIHTFSKDGVEAIMCHGRISIFKDGREVTAPRGAQMVFNCMGQWHESTLADWIVTERGPDFCRAQGRMSRLPITLFWDLKIENGRMIWDASIECEREVTLSHVNADIYLPPSYDTWFSGERSGRFPNILPGDLGWAPVSPFDPSLHELAALPEKENDAPAAHVLLDPKLPYLTMQWFNSDYVQGSRVCQISGQAPEKLAAFTPGRHKIFTAEMNLSATEESIRARVATLEIERTVESGRFKAVFTQGKIRCFWDDEEFTAALHFYASAFIGGMWNDSTAFHWNSPRAKGQGFVVTGESRRFPFSQHWEIEPAPNGINITIWLEATEPLDVDEYHASIVLRPQYSEWKTEKESGEYPAISLEQKDWRHLNRIYAPCAASKALSSTLPSVILTAKGEAPAFRMTAINTGVADNARVLQALRTPDSGALRFEPGKSLYFAGTVTVEAP